MIGAQAPLGEQLLDVAVRKGKAQVPTASRMTFGSNCRHLNKLQTEEARRSIRPAYHGVPAKLQHFPIEGTWGIHRWMFRTASARSGATVITLNPGGVSPSTGTVSVTKTLRIAG